MVSVFLVAATAIGFIIPIFGKDKTEISVDLTADPIGESGDSAETANPALTNRELVSEIVLNADNVQRLIATLSRPSHYYLTSSITLASTDEMINYIGKQWKSDGRIKTVISDNVFRNELHYLEQGGTVYSWKQGDVSYNTLPVGEFSSDDLLMLPTYEDVVEFDKSMISECGIEKFGSIDCISVLVEYPDFAYSERYLISIDMGLLVSAETFKDGDTIYREAVDFFSYNAPDENVFTLPDSSSPLLGSN